MNIMLTPNVRKAFAKVFVIQNAGSDGGNVWDMAMRGEKDFHLLLPTTYESAADLLDTTVELIYNQTGVRIGFSILQGREEDGTPFRMVEASPNDDSDWFFLGTMNPQDDFETRIDSLVEGILQLIDVLVSRYEKVFA